MKSLVVLALFAAAAAEPNIIGKREAEPNEAAPVKAAPTRHLGYGKREAEQYNWKGGYPGSFPYVATPEIAPYGAGEHLGRKKREAEAVAKAAAEAAANGAKKAGYGYAAPAAAPVAKYGYGYGYEPTAERADHIYGIQEMGGYHGYLGKREAEDDWSGYPYVATPEIAPYGAAEYLGRKKRHAEAAAKAAAAAAPNSGGAKRAGYGYGYGYVYAPVEIRGYRTSVAERGVRPVAERAGHGGVAEKVDYHAIGKRETGRGKRSGKAAPLVCIQGYASGWSVCSMGRPRAGLP